jgi:branched-chain amino acid transport system substrate-binding protein
MSRHSAKRRRFGIATAVVLALATTACGAGSASEAASSPDTIKMHANFEFSGPGALYGVSKAIGVRVARDLINEEGGITVGGKAYQLEVVECDNRTEPTYGVQCAQEAVDEEVLWTAAPDLGFEGAYEIYKANNILTVGNGGAPSTFLMDEPEKHPLLVFELLAFQQSAEAHLIHLRQMYPNLKRIATLFSNDANGQVWDVAWRELGPKYGFEVVAQEMHPTDASGDFSTYLTALGKGKPELIHLGHYPNVVAPAAAQGAALGVADMFSGEGVTLDNLAGTDLDGKPFIGFQYAYNWFEGYEPSDAKLKDLTERFEKASKGEPYLPSVVLLGFIGETMMVKDAIEAADSLDPKAIAAAWSKVKYDGPFGPAVGTPNKSTDQSRSHFVVDAKDNVTVHVFPTGYADKPSEVVNTGPRTRG